MQKLFNFDAKKNRFYLFFIFLHFIITFVSHFLIDIIVGLFLNLTSFYIFNESMVNQLRAPGEIISNSEELELMKSGLFTSLLPINVIFLFASFVMGYWLNKKIYKFNFNG
ncbi:MAG: hypothetical protein WAU01_11835 [Saprospiraceae bacterium]